MTGNWFGYYRYDRQDVQKIIGFEKTFFTLTITSFDGTHFKGIVNDDTNTGGMKDTGEVTGYVDKNKIFFKKFMPKRNIIVDRKGTTKTTGTKTSDIVLFWNVFGRQERDEWSLEI